MTADKYAIGIKREWRIMAQLRVCLNEPVDCPVCLLCPRMGRDRNALNIDIAFRVVYACATRAEPSVSKCATGIIITGLGF